MLRGVAKGIPDGQPPRRHRRRDWRWTCRGAIRSATSWPDVVYECWRPRAERRRVVPKRQRADGAPRWQSDSWLVSSWWARRTPHSGFPRFLPFWRQRRRIGLDRTQGHPRATRRGPG